MEKVRAPPRNPLSVSEIVILVVTKIPADFVGSALGESEKNTKAILDATVGKVLVIDEASVKFMPPSIPTDCCLRHTVCMVVAGRAVVAAHTIRTKPQSLIRLLRRFRVYQAKTDVSCSLDTRNK